MHEVQLLNRCIEDKNEIIEYLHDIIMSHNGNCYDDVIKIDYRPSVFEALTDRRTAEFGWYDFEPRSKVLELGAGWGEVTGELAMKCGRVVAVEENLHKAKGICKRHADKDNLAVYAGDWHCLSGEGCYDYVIFHDVEKYLAGRDNEQLSALVKILCTFLKPEGRLLMHIANRYALKYWCGEPKMLEQPECPNMSDISNQNGLSKQEIELELAQADSIRYKFYYPMFDRYKPQQVFTDACLPDASSLKAMELYRRNKNVLLNDVREMYASIIKEGTYPLFAEAFLVECTRDKGQLSNIKFAKISADRPRELAMGTVIMDDAVIKTALFKEGYSHLQDMMNYQKDLQAHNIPIVSMEYRNDVLVMPLIKQKKLGEHLKHLAKIDSEAFVACLDRLYDYICHSSEHLSVEESSFCLQAKDVDWGPILKHAYLELIDLNCFYDDDFLFFDQEYMREAMPAKYIMYRELINLYYAYPEIEQSIKKNDMFIRFGIDDLLEILEKEEYGNFLGGLVDKALCSRLFQPHGDGAFNPESSHQQQIRRETYLFAGCAEKILVVIGSGTRFKRYMSQYGKRYSPDVLVDNNSTKWGEAVSGIVVSGPQKMKEYDPNMLHIIICIKDYEAIEAQLLEMGIYNYRIF